MQEVMGLLEEEEAAAAEAVAALACQVEWKRLRKRLEAARCLGMFRECLGWAHNPRLRYRQFVPPLLGPCSLLLHCHCSLSCMRGTPSGHLGLMKCG